MTKYIIADRHRGAYSERFDCREDAERAIRFFCPFNALMGQRCEILECTQFDGTWIIADPTIPVDTFVAIQ